MESESQNDAKPSSQGLISSPSTASARNESWRGARASACSASTTLWARSAASRCAFMDRWFTGDYPTPPTDPRGRGVLPAMAT